MKPALLILLLLSGHALANDGSCYTVANPDARAYCLAKARKDPGTCYTIQAPGLRSMCLAEVKSS